MKLFSAILSFVCLTAIACAQLDEKPIRAVGIVSLEVFPGRPNYESIKDGDEAEKAWILTVASKEKKERFQLVVEDGSEQKFAALRRLTGKKAVVEGLVWEGHTGHHHTPFLISIRTIQEAPNQAAQTTPGLRPSVSDL